IARGCFIATSFPLVTGADFETSLGCAHDGNAGWYGGVVAMVMTAEVSGAIQMIKTYPAGEMGPVATGSLPGLHSTRTRTPNGLADRMFGSPSRFVRTNVDHSRHASLA